MRPFVFINVAATADGKIDTIERKGAAISSAADKERVQRLRAEADAVMVGGHTLLGEDPGLVVKDPGLRAERRARGLSENPIKVGVVTCAESLNLEGDFMAAGSARRVIFTTAQTSAERADTLTSRGVEVYFLGEKRVNLSQALEKLYALGVRRLMVEGGATLNFELLRAGFVDELCVYVAPLIFGGQSSPTLADGEGLAMTGAIHLKLIDTRVLEGGGVVLHYEPTNLRGKGLQ